ALQIPAFRQIVAMPQVTLPVAGVAYNVNANIGHDGIVGVKTGSSSQAGGCLAFAAIRTVAGSPVTIVGVVLGVRATAARPSQLGGVIAPSENPPASLGPDLEHAQGLTPGGPREPAGQWGRQVTCPGPARFARCTRRGPGRRSPAGSPAPRSAGSLAPKRSQPGAGAEGDHGPWRHRPGRGESM